MKLRILKSHAKKGKRESTKWKLNSKKFSALQHSHIKPVIIYLWKLIDWSNKFHNQLYNLCSDKSLFGLLFWILVFWEFFLKTCFPTPKNKLNLCGTLFSHLVFFLKSFSLLIKNHHHPRQSITITNPDPPPPNRV